MRDHICYEFLTELLRGAYRVSGGLKQVVASVCRRQRCLLRTVRIPSAILIYNLRGAMLPDWDVGEHEPVIGSRGVEVLPGRGVRQNPGDPFFEGDAG